MGLFKLLRFYGEASSYVTPDATAITEAGDDAGRHIRYHRRIVLLSGVCGGVGAAAGVAFMIAGGRPGDDTHGLYLAPLMFGAAGLLFGAAVACLVAPRAFLTGPVGRKWMALIGTTSVPVARAACLALGLIVTLPVVGLGLLIAFGK
jgi:hypothetical protein